MRRHIQDYCALPVPSGTAAVVLRNAPDVWLPPGSLELTRDGGRHVQLPGGPVVVRVGPCIETAAVFLRRLAVIVEGEAADSLEVRCDLELRGTREGLSRLDVCGSYREPLSVHGLAVDRTTVQQRCRELLHAIAGAIAEAVRDPAGVAPSTLAG